MDEVEHASVAEETERHQANVTGLDVRQQRELERLQVRARDFLHTIFISHASSAERVSVLHKNLEFFLKHLDGAQAESIRAQIDACQSINDEQAFVAQTLQAVQPVLRLQAERPDVARQIFHERHEFIPLNDVLAYGLDNDGTVAHIHLAPSADISNLREIVVSGLRELAHRIRDDEAQFTKLERVIAQSWIVTQHPKILEHLGFSIEGPVGQAPTERARQEGENRIASRAYIDVQDFLQRYG